MTSKNCLGGDTELENTASNRKSHCVTILQNKLQNKIKDGNSANLIKIEGSSATVLKTVQIGFRVLFMLECLEIFPLPEVINS